MKENSFYILLLLLFGACNTGNKGTVDNKVVAPDIIVDNSTAYHFPQFKNPPGFYSDTISLYDSLSQANYFSVFLQSTQSELQGFNKSIALAVKKRMEYEQLYVDPFTGNGAVPAFTYELKPTNFYSDTEVISITHVIDTYAEGGNHHNYTWFTFNYNLKKNTPIYFKDLFYLRNIKDTLAFLDIVNGQPDTTGCNNWVVSLADTDFSFAKDGIIFNTESSACGSRHIVISFNSCSKYLKASNSQYK